MKDIEQRKSPLQIKMDELGKKLSIFSFAIIACIMALGIFQGKTFLSMFNIGKLSGNCPIGRVISVVYVLF
jgi:P-type Ca2+ transporter type 2C